MEATQARTIAQTILEQLGGKMFVTMTGAKNLLSTGRGLSMKVGGGWYVRINLEASDLYTVEIFKLRKYQRINESTYRDVYAEDLRRIFTEKTGLYTSMKG